MQTHTKHLKTHSWHPKTCPEWFLEHISKNRRKSKFSNFSGRRPPKNDPKLTGSTSAKSHEIHPRFLQKIISTCSDRRQVRFLESCPKDSLSSQNEQLHYIFPQGGSQRAFLHNSRKINMTTIKKSASHHLKNEKSQCRHSNAHCPGICKLPKPSFSWSFLWFIVVGLHAKSQIFSKSKNLKIHECKHTWNT